MIFYGSSVTASLEHEELINIETNISEKGLPVFEIYGLINKSIEESKKRIISSFEILGINFPLRNITINLSPAEIYKEGTHYDLSIAATILRFTNLLVYDERKDLFLGELAFDGSVRPLKNIVYLVLIAQKLGFKRIYVPLENISDLFYLEGIKIFGVKNLKDLLNLEDCLLSTNWDLKDSHEIFPTNFSKILGNKNNKKILSYSLSGKHHLLLNGFPGSGKSLLAKSAQDLLPNLDITEAYSVAKIYSYLNIKRSHEDFLRPPFRSPHNSSSYSSIFGSSGKNIIPGEVTVSNKGILFLDELPEFNRLVLEGLRAPLEDKQITISRSKIKKVLPTDFIMLATMNPCRCGYFNHPKIDCRCLPIEIKRYQNKISGPILDRIDIFLNYDGNVNILDSKEHNIYTYEEFVDLKNRILNTRQMIMSYFVDKKDIRSKDSLNNNLIQSLYNEKSIKLLNTIQEKYSISNRRYFKIINLAITISFFNRNEKIEEDNILEALALTGYKF